MNDRPAFRPLYRQVHDIVVSGIAEGRWRPGEALPSEQKLAREMGVSQCTLRKALDSLATAKLLERRQGQGTFVAENTEEQALFRFFRLARAGGIRVMPESLQEAVELRTSRTQDRTKLDLARGARVVEITSTRLIDARPTIHELIVVPAALFPGIEQRRTFPNSL